MVGIFYIASRRAGLVLGKCVSLESVATGERFPAVAREHAAAAAKRGTTRWRHNAAERDVAALRQLREKDPAPTLLFTRDVARPTDLR